MPLINGQKMACEPCIRGHRSTKCTHANERLMVPVRKPGRPLSTCPHPPTRGCGCGSVTAAIPRKQKCGCGSSTGTPTDSSSSSSIIKGESPATDAPPTSPIKAPAASFRVQKSAKSTSRKQSFDPTALERMDAAHVNILPPFDMAPAHPMPHANGMSAMSGPRPGMEYGAMPMMAPVNGGYHQPMMYPMFPQQMPPVYPPAAAMQMPPAGRASTAGTPNVAPSPAPAKATNGGGGSCCSGSANGTAKAPVTPALPTVATGGSCCSGSKKSEGTSTQPSSVTSSPKAEPKPKTGGCCSSKAPPINTNVVNGHMPNSHMSPNGMVMSPFQTPIGMPQGMYQSYFPQTTIFTYPPQYGSWMSPLQPAQWRQTMDALQYGQPVPQPTGYNMSAPIGFAPDGANGGIAESTSHECGCGDGCQCVGCAAHPYNDATQDYVRSAWESMQEESHMPTNGTSTNGHLETASTNGTGVRAAPEPHANGETGGSPPAPQTPSDAASGLSEEQALSASDFFFVTYPFGGEGCAGETLSCPCGDDCQCLGCTIHNNSPLPES